MSIQSRRLFAALVAAQLAHTGTAIWQHRIPSAHDGFQFFTLQYYFLNNAIQSGDVAQWIPYMTHGTTATMWYAVQSTMLQQVILPAAGLFRHADLLTVFHLNMFFDEMVLLVGTWLVARRFFGAAATFFVTVSVVGSCVWLDQPYWNFRLYYALPLVIEMGHRFLETGRWRWAALALNLLALQTLGNLPYVIPLASFVVAAYFAWYSIAHWGDVVLTFRKLRPGVPAVAALAFGALSLAGAYEIVAIGKDQVVSYNAGRAPDGTTDLNGFLTYGGATDLFKWLDALLNLSASFDFTLYAGILLIPLVVAGLCAVDRRRVHFVLLAITLLMFTLATPVATALYYVWPGMKYFRHIGLVSPLVKVLCCFVAGLGFELLFDPAPGMTPRRIRIGMATAVLVLTANVAVIARIAPAGPRLDAVVNRLSDPGVDRPPHVQQRSALVSRLLVSLGLSVAGAGLIVLVPIVPRRHLACAVLVFAAADVYHFKFAHLRDRSEAVSSSARAVTRPAALPFVVQREPNLQHAVATSERLRQSLNVNTGLLQRMQGRFSPGAKYWTSNAFFFVDEVGSSTRVDSWLAPLNQLMRTYRAEPVDDVTTPPPSLAFDRLDFPLEHPSAGAVVGSSGKIRFFNRAHRVASPEQLAPLMANPDYRGTLLFVLTAHAADGTEPWKGNESLSADESSPASFSVRRFDANHVVLTVNNPSAQSVWMSYADVWHPDWHATLNGREAPVYRAQMAYKAVRLDPGENVLGLEFGSRRFSTLAMAFAVNAAIWLGLVVLLIVEIVRART